MARRIEAPHATFLVAAVIGGSSACARDARPATPAPVPSPTTGAAVDTRRTSDAASGNVLVDPGAARPRGVVEAIAVLHPTRGNNVRGTVRFREANGGALEVTTRLEGLPGSVHAYHIHVYGDCSARDAASAGPHFHFSGSSLDENVDIITGNLGELVPDARGRVTQQAMRPLASLHGAYSILGRAVVVHAKGNDPTVTPDGGAGDRIACGVIGIARPEETRPAETARR